MLIEGFLLGAGVKMWRAGVMVIALRINKAYRDRDRDRDDDNKIYLSSIQQPYMWYVYITSFHARKYVCACVCIS